MVTTFNKSDMIKFGKFITDQINEGIKTPGPDGKHFVSHADWENFLVGQKVIQLKAWKSITIDKIPEDKREAFKELKPFIDSLIELAEDPNGEWS